METTQLAKSIADNLRADGTITVLIGTRPAREIFDAVKANTPVIGVISRTGRTLHLALVTEHPNRLGHNQRHNHAATMQLATQVRSTEPHRVWI